MSRLTLTLALRFKLINFKRKMTAWRTLTRAQGLTIQFGELFILLLASSATQSCIVANGSLKISFLRQKVRSWLPNVNFRVKKIIGATFFLASRKEKGRCAILPFGLVAPGTLQFF